MTGDWINFVRVKEDSMNRAYRMHWIEQAWIGIQGFGGNSRRKETTKKT
jgi:hypothetical protein